MVRVRVNISVRFRPEIKNSSMLISKLRVSLQI